MVSTTSTLCLDMCMAHTKFIKTLTGRDGGWYGSFQVAHYNALKLFAHMHVIFHMDLFSVNW